MSFKRFFLWTCDFCSTTTDREPFGHPEGWIAVVKIKTPIRHACPKCKAGLNLRPTHSGASVWQEIES